MQVGDLVRIVVGEERWCHAGRDPRDHPGGALGLVLGSSGTDWIVLWNTGSKCSYPAFQLEALNESR